MLISNIEISLGLVLLVKGYKPEKNSLILEKGVKQPLKVK
jgi:hypothetical protein